MNTIKLKIEFSPLEKRTMWDWNHCLAFVEDDEHMELWVLIVVAPVLLLLLLPKINQRKNLTLIPTVFSTQLMPHF